MSHLLIKILTTTEVARKLGLGFLGLKKILLMYFEPKTLNKHH
jgi:hypothetical protein